jgi:hypothetical protein
MKFKDITVSGLTDIVINRESKWVHLPSGTWQRELKPGAPDINGRGVYTHEQMMDIVEHLKTDRRFRMWIAIGEGGSLNIVRK